MFKNVKLFILFDMILDSSFRMMTGFVNIARTTASTSIICILGNISNPLDLGVYMKNNS